MKDKEIISGRKAGILLHITSLPGGFYIGDMGPESYKFVDFLVQSGQTYWQILPLNQVDKNKAYSPYSPISAFAGNTLLISPEKLQELGLIEKLPPKKRKYNTSQADFEKAELMKGQILDEAYRNFREGDFELLHKEFDQFCNQEKYWLNDYSLFLTFKKLNNNIPWNLWEKKYKNKEEGIIKRIQEDFTKEIESIKFSQFLFLKQWKSLKEYSNKNGVKIFGDIPIYIGFDSADVWSHPNYFKLTPQKEPLGIAGVPPDYFNENGQLWEMPVFNWDENKKDNYGWWKERIRKNIQLFDLLRVDHFRGYSDFWEVPATERTAINGKWVKGPGIDLFDALKNEFHELPFVAEDLGDIDQTVYDLRDRYHLPGMSILMFTFGDNTHDSIHSPHNFRANTVAYTGTHDNNTVKGWYKTETGKTQRHRISQYIGRKISSSGISKELIRLVYQSVAKLAIVPMQDVLNLGTKARMNIPSVEKGNWGWRLRKKQIRKKNIITLNKWSEIYGRKH
jgi:4-alpha-glucanotransferase